MGQIDIIWSVLLTNIPKYRHRNKRFDLIQLSSQPDMESEFLVQMNLSLQISHQSSLRNLIHCVRQFSWTLPMLPVHLQGQSINKHGSLSPYLQIRQISVLEFDVLISIFGGIGWGWMVWWPIFFRWSADKSTSEMTFGMKKLLLKWNMQELRFDMTFGILFGHVNKSLLLSYPENISIERYSTIVKIGSFCNLLFFYYHFYRIIHWLKMAIKFDHIFYSRFKSKPNIDKKCFKGKKVRHTYSHTVPHAPIHFPILSQFCWFYTKRSYLLQKFILSIIKSIHEHTEERKRSKKLREKNQPHIIYCNLNLYWKIFIAFSFWMK